MPDFKSSNIIFFAIITLLFLAKFTFGFSALWLSIPFIIYSFIVFLGVKNICSQFFLKVQCVSDDKSKIHLTFDDGPHPIITPQILEVLKNHNQKAVFFCVGKNIEQFPEIIKQIIEQGHDIGNHSYSHSIGFDFMSSQKVNDELEKTNNLIEQFTGKSNRLFRPPYGVTNPNIAKAVKQLGMKTIGWSIRSLDTVKSPSVVQKRLMNVKPGDIILFHDTIHHTPEILEEFLRFLKNNDHNEI